MSATNSHMYGAATGNGVAVTDGGNVNTTVLYDNIINVGRVVLRNNVAYQLPDIQASWVKIHADATNVQNVFLGGIADQQAQLDVGYPIIPGASIELPCTNSNQFSLFPGQDGNTVYIIVGGVGNASDITPGTPGVLDITPPSIVSEIPIAGLSGQAINVDINALADRALDPSSVNSTNVTLTPTPSGFMPTVDSGNPANILLLYTGFLASNTVHTVNINGLANINGYTQTVAKNYTFTTSSTTTPPSTTPPTITSTNPTSGATNVSTSISPTITFSQAILASSITTTSIKITDVSGPTFLTGYTFSQSGDLKTVTINGLTLANSKQYRIDVFNASSPAGAGIENTVGIFLDNIYSITFTTIAPSILFYNVAGTSGSYSSLNGLHSNYQMSAIYCNSTSSILVGKTPVACSFVLKKVGNPTGNLICQMDSVDQAQVQHTLKFLGSTPASTVGTSDTSISFSFPTNTTKFALRVALSLYYQSGDSNNYILSKVSTSDAFDGQNTCLIRYLWDGTFDGKSLIDMAGTINVAP
jgi:hypothetical protein